MAQVFIGGVPFMALDHHDGRFVRTGGLFAFARRTPSDGILLLHFEMTAAINRVADPTHPRWAWCLAQGMDTLLVHMAGRLAGLPADVSPDLETVRWHPQAEVVMVASDHLCDRLVPQAHSGGTACSDAAPSTVVVTQSPARHGL